MASDVQVTHAADGTLVVVGSGWHSGQQLIVSLGSDSYTAYVDSAGEFEVATGRRFASSGPSVVAVHHVAPISLSFASLAEREPPPPLAVLFAQSVAEGSGLLVLALTLAATGIALERRLRRGSYPRR